MRSGLPIRRLAVAAALAAVFLSSSASARSLAQKKAQALAQFQSAEKVREELDEFLAEEDPIRREEEFGDLLFSLVNFARHAKIEPETALRKATIKFDRRFREVEKIVEASGNAWEKYSLKELDAFWDTVKKLPH